MRACAARWCWRVSPCCWPPRRAPSKQTQTPGSGTTKRCTSRLSVALGIGVLKEVWDLTGHGDASWKDLAWDLVGTTTGIFVAYAIDWMILRLRTPAPAP